MGSQDFPLQISIVFGDDDYMRIISGDDSKKLIADKKGCKFHVLRDCGHVLNKDNPVDLTTFIINDFLDKGLTGTYAEYLSDI